MIVPFLDLKKQSQKIAQEVFPLFGEIIESAGFVGGSHIQKFEEEFARFCKTEYCVAVNSGTDALRFALIASGIKTGDEVITVPNTFIATSEAITQSGGRPVFVDIDPRTYNIDVNKIEQTITSKTKAIIPVHLYGQCADMDIVVDIAHRYGLVVIEDACQAHGAEYKGKRAGSLGLIGCFSFYPGKNLGAFGEGGAIVTDDDNLAKKIRMLRDHGQIKKYEHETEGYNGRLDTIQAAVLKVKLKYLEEWNALRREHAMLYKELLGNMEEIVLPFEPEWSRAVYHLYVIRVKNRNGLQQELLKLDIQTGLHYPTPLHLQKAYAHLECQKGTFPIAEQYSQEILSLPMFPELDRTQIEYVAESIKMCLYKLLYVA